jgi:fibronectin-binding autotransporter adhesin
MIRLLACILFVGLAVPGRAAAQTYIWPGDQVGNWGDPRWRLSTAQGTNVPAPGAADSVAALNGGTAFILDITDARLIKDVTYNNGNATLRIQSGGSLNASGSFTQSNGALVINGGLTVGGAFTLNGGTVSGTGSLTLNGAYNWTGGSISGNVVAANGGSLGGGGATLAILTGSLTYGGFVNWDSGNVTMSNGTTFTLSSGATMIHTTSANSSIQVASGVTTGAFVNNGTLVHDTTTNQSIILQGNLLFTNAGTVRALSGINQTGIVSIRSTTTTTGVFDTGNATDGEGIISLDGGGTTTFNSGASVIGTGQFRVTHTVNLNAAIPASNLIVAGGTIQGTGSMTLSGPLTWNGTASMAGSATLTTPVGSTFSNHVTLNSASVLNLNGAGATHSWNSHTFTLNGTSAVNVGVGATFLTVANQTFRASSGTPSLNIAGTFRKQTATGETNFGTGAVTTVVNNSGTIAVEAGTVRFFNGTLNNTGTLSVLNSGVLSFSDSSTLNLNAGSLGQGSGLIRFESNSATANVNAATAITNFTMTGGTIQGTQTLTAAGTVTIDGGTIGQTAVLKGTGGGSVGNLTVNTGTLQLGAGTFSWTNGITFSGSGFVQIDNGATFQMTGDRSLTRSAGTPNLVVNGTLVKTAGTGNGIIGQNIGVTIGSTGVINSQSGTLRVESNTTNNGVLRASSGGRVEFTQPITLSGTGLIDVAGGTLLLTSGGTITVPSGMSFTNAGTVQAQSTTLAINAGATLTNFASNTLTGGVWQAFGGTINFGGRTVGTIASGTEVWLASGGQMVGLSSTAIQNNGQLRITSGSTLATGTVNVAGLMEVGSSSTLSGNVVVQNGGGLGGRGSVVGNATVQSGGIVSPGSGPYTFPGHGQLSLGATALQGGAQYVWELSSWATNPSAGTDFDQIRGGQGGVKLDLAGASSSNRITLRIVSLNAGMPGLIPGFNPEAGRSWVIADYSNGNLGTGNGILNFSADKFTLDTFLFGNEPGSAQFSLSLSANSNQLILTYNPVPEPAAVMLVAASAALCLRRLRRCKTS